MELFPCLSTVLNAFDELQRHSEDKDTYKELHLIECFFNKMKNYRRPAMTRQRACSRLFGFDFDKDMAEIGLRTGPRIIYIHVTWGAKGDNGLARIQNFRR